ncbi:hypothetical protein DOY81_008002 [Sarcophaga bullata]|nr:hypothetical protein DOY81_008002 [Sarcophaga bullata]
MDTPKKGSLSESTTTHPAKKFIEPITHKEILKLNHAACSPSSTSSTSSSTSSSSNASSSSSGSRFLPDMSKLDISGNSSSTSTSLSSPSTTSTSSTSYASACAKEKKAKLMKLDEKATTASPLVADAKLVHHSTASTTTTITGPATNQMKIQLSSQPVITAQTKQQGDSSLFDTVRKSPSFNLNINALNEELAQTVQETTRALTDALQSPQPPPAVLTPNPAEITPTKSKPPSHLSTPTNVVTTQSNATTSSTTTQPIIASPKLSTPPSATSTTTAKPLVGSPFIETRSVFELSFGSGSSSRENKFELENAKVLLSATGGAFDFDPSKLETKPTTSSIADKVLKAISQKKEEKENKKQEAAAAAAGQAKDKESDTKDEKSNISSLATSNLNTTLKSSLESLNLSNSFTSSATSASLLNDPLKINTDIPTLSSGGSLLSGPLNTFLANRRTPLTSPEPKMGILESMGGTKNQLTETIQKLECAIQRRTPVTSHPVTPTTPLSTTNPENFSDDSNDSTDSERRLVIEDVADDSGATTTTTPVEQKPSPVLLGPESCKPASTAVKLETTMGATKITYAAHHDIPAPIPIKAVIPSTISRHSTTPSSTSTPSSNMTSLTATTTTSLISIVPASTTSVVYPSKPVIQTNPQQLLPTANVPQFIQKSVLIMPTTVTQNQSQMVSERNLETNTNMVMGQNNNTSGGGISSTPQKQTPNTQRPNTNPVVTASAGVPIVLPDIPASVVVASTAVPSVMAAAQAAAAALQTPKQSAQKHLQQQSSQHSLASGITRASIVTTTSSLLANPSQSLNVLTSVQTSNPTAFVSTAKSYDNTTTTVRPIAQSLKPITTSGLIQTSSKGGFQPLSAPTQPTSTGPTSTSGFYLDPRTELRPDDGLKPLGEIPKPTTIQLTTTNLTTKDISTPPPTSVSTLANNATSTPNAAEISSILGDTHNDAIMQLRCEETIPGSPASVITGREDSQERTATSLITENNVNSDKDFSTLHSNKSLASGLASTAVASSSTTTSAGIAATASSSPNDSGSQEDESSEDLKKSVDVENEISPRKRRRPRKQTENSSMVTESLQQQQQQQQQQHHQHSKRRRQLTCNKKNAAGSDSDDNSDNVSQRSSTHYASSRHQQQNLSQQQTQQSSTTGSKPCPYNFLVQLDPSINPDQCIAILLKQIQDLRKTYNIIKSDLASIDRRRKKLRRREREKKQQQLQQQQQQMKVG